MCVRRHARGERDPNFIRADQPHASLPFRRFPPESFPFLPAFGFTPRAPSDLRAPLLGGGFRRREKPSPDPTPPSQCEIRQPLLNHPPNADTVVVPNEHEQHPDHRPPRDIIPLAGHYVGYM